MLAFMEARIAKHVAAPIPPTNPTYDQEPLGHKTTMIRIRDDIPKEDMPPRRRFVLTAPPLGCDVAESSAAAARAPRRQYDFVDTIKTGQGLIHSPGHDAQTVARATDRAEDVGYVRALQASEHRMMTSIKEVNLGSATRHRDIRLEIYVVRGQRTAYETKLHEVWIKQKSQENGAEKTIQGVKYMVAELNIIHKPSLVNSIKGMTRRHEESTRECGIYTRSTLRRSTRYRNNGLPRWILV
ncbi:hypothetical protein Tco_0802815 [Tanacetum coccineum]|uniref:Uncharacterized protein n=1 Tax=Tanacetum coccineum TaxID=301880 RepID=A0ABQ5A3X2_9ASTR